MKKSFLSIPVGTLAVVLLLSLATASVFGTGSSSSPNAAEKVWGNGVEWQMIAPPNAHGSANPAEPLYVVAPQTATPQSTADNNHIPGVAHDHVLAPPAHNSGDFNGNWHVFVVLCTPSGINAGTCTPDFVTFPGPGGPGTGPTLPLAKSINGAALMSDAAITAGTGSNGPATLFDTGITFVCLITPIQ